MHAYVNKERQTIEFKEGDLTLMGAQMGQTLHLHTWMINIDEFAKLKLRRQIQIKKKKKELQRQIQQKLADLNQAQEESDVQSAKVSKTKKPEKKLSSA
jgi:hypothetical protein